MTDNIENICIEAHKLGKRELLLKEVTSLRQKHCNIPLAELFQKAFENIVKSNDFKCQ